MIKDNNFFEIFFQGQAQKFLYRSIDLALEEDGPDWTSQALFHSNEQLKAQIICKQDTLCVGLPLIQIVLNKITDADSLIIQLHTKEGQKVLNGSQLATITGPAYSILKAERVILNYLSHLSGIANNTSSFVQQILGSQTKILDTRKTLPGLRYPEKYAVRMGGGVNHRFNLQDMLMLKDNHIDKIGSISAAVTTLRKFYSPCPAIEVECRNHDDVLEAVQCRVERIMLDNMPAKEIKKALLSIPEDIESEISGGVTLENIKSFAELGAKYISIGCLTNSAPIADFSMLINSGTFNK